MAGKSDVVKKALQLIDNMGPEITASGIRAYHGSPYKFDKFDISKLGTGEGAQAYGHGLYFAGKEDIAKWYKEKLAYNKLKQKFLDELPQDADPDEVIDLINKGYFEPDQTRFLTELKNNDWLGYDYPSQAISAARKGGLDDYDPTPELRDAVDKFGHMYEVGIDADPNRLMDWNKALKEQPADVQSAVMPFAEYRANTINKARKDALDKGVDWRGRPYSEDKLKMYNTVVNPEDFTGQDVYKHLQIHLGANNPNEKAAEASQYLTDQGLHGMQFLDASSRAPGIIEATNNFVIPEDKRIKILRRYAEGGEVEDGRDDFGKGGLVEKALDIIRAYHVSPHDFDKFEWSPRTRSTGEGAQAYGEGLYFAESPSVSGRGGEYWRNFMDKSQSKLGPWDAMAANTLMRSNWDRAKAIEELRGQQSKFSEFSSDPDQYVARHHRNMAETSRLAADLLEAGHHVGPHTYEVEIKANPTSLLDWDNPYSPEALEQFAAKFDSTNPSLRRAIEDYGYQREKRGDIGPDGQDMMMNIFAKGPGPSWGTSSRDLLEAGVPGIRYWDGNSRGRAYIGEWRNGDGGIAKMTFPTKESAEKHANRKGDGWTLQQVTKNPNATSNYVIFDDKLINIKDKYATGGVADADRDIESALMTARLM